MEKVIVLNRISKLTKSIVSIIVLVLLDQGTKRLAYATLSEKGTVPILGDFFVFVYATNRGGFLSFGSGISDKFWSVFFVIMPIAALVLLSAYIVVKKRDDWYYLSFWVFVVSGGIGNVLDRIMYGEVIDFMNIGIGNVRTGVFNVADLYLNVFALLVVLIYFIRGKHKEEMA